MAKPKQVEEVPEKYPPGFDDPDEEEEEKEEQKGEMEVEDLTEPRIKSGKEKRTLRVSGSPSTSFNIDTNKKDRPSSPHIGIPTCPIKPLWAFQMPELTVIEMSFFK